MGVREIRIINTWQLPRIKFVKIDDGNHVELEFLSFHLFFQIVSHEFLVGGMETETGRKSQRVHRRNGKGNLKT